MCGGVQGCRITGVRLTMSFDFVKRRVGRRARLLGKGALRLLPNVPPALCQVGIFVTDVYKYTEKFERIKLKNRREVQTLTITDKSLKPHLHKTAVLVAQLKYTKKLV
jgi:hypothetical protein